LLVLTRRSHESIIIQENIIVTILAVEGDRVKLGIDAPQDVNIFRHELLEAVREENLAAAQCAEISNRSTLLALSATFRNTMEKNAEEPSKPPAQEACSSS